MKILLRFSRLVLSLAALLATAFAQNRAFTNQYTFGDSLSDNGNAYLLGGKAFNAGPPLYFGGRWSNGLVFAEQLGNTLALGSAVAPSVKTSMDFAFGTAATTTALNYTGSPVPAMPTQLQMFQSHAVSVQRTDLFTVWFGANDLLTTTTTAAPALNFGAMDVAGINAAQNTAGFVQSLINLGAKNILVINMPDIGLTPFGVSTGGGAGFLTRGSLAYNAEFDARLKAVAAGARDVNLVRIDAAGMISRIQRDYKLLGYTTMASSLADDTAAGRAGDPNGYVFLDGVHPTARTHTLLARVILEALNPEPVLGVAATEGTAALALQGLAASALDSRVAQLASSARTTGRADVYASFNYGDGNRAADGLRSKFNYTGQVVTAGVDSRVSDGVFLGGALNVGRMNAKLSAGAGNFSIEDNTGRLYSVWRGGPVALAIDADYGEVRVKGIHRSTAFGGFQTNGKTDGTHWGAGLKAAWTLDGGGFTARPWLGVRTERVKLGAYTETDVPALSMAFDAQEAKSSAGGLGFDLGTDTKLGARALHLECSAAWHGELSSRTRNVSGQLANNFTQTTVVGVKDGDGNGFALGAAGTLMLAKNWSATLGYAADIRSNDKLASRCTLSVQTGF
jgi:outer membrane lipase/esterase